MKRRNLAERRKTVGYSQEALAEELDVDRSTVVRWERVERTPQPWHRPKLARALKVSLDELEVLLSNGTDDDGHGRGHDRGHESSNAMFAGSARIVPSRFAWPATEEVIDVLARIQQLRRSVSPEMVQHLADNLDQVVEGYEQLDHGFVVPVLISQRAWVDTLLDQSHRLGQRQQLYEIAAGTSGLLSYMAVGRGDFRLARAYCAEAFQLGEHAHNSDLQAWTRGVQSICEYYARDYEQALRLAIDGLTYAKSGPQSVRLTINGVARAKGKLGDADGVHRAVDEAYELMSRNHAPSTMPSSITFGCYSAAQIASNAATAYLALGQPEKVEQYVEVALPDIDASDSPWSRSLVMIDLATSEIRSKRADVERASHIMLEALRISADRPILSVHQRAMEFVQDAHRRWGNTASINAIRDAITVGNAP